jgi:hypothetical protein
MSHRPRVWDEPRNALSIARSTSVGTRRKRELPSIALALYISSASLISHHLLKLPLKYIQWAREQVINDHAGGR